jgi:hypothetical protein
MILPEEQPKTYIHYTSVPCTWEGILSMGYDKVVEIVKSWKEISAQNVEIYKFNNNLFNDALLIVKNVFDESGVKYFRTGAYGKVLGKTKEAVVFMDTLAVKYKIRQPSCPSLSSISYNNERLSTISGDPLATLQSAKRSYEFKLKQKEDASKHFQMAMKVAKEENIDISNCANSDEVYRTVNLFMRDKFEADNYPVGTKMELKHGCDYCSEWEVGDHRCSCGNRRVSLCVEGDFISGFYAYPECN